MFKLIMEINVHLGSFSFIIININRNIIPLIGIDLEIELNVL